MALGERLIEARRPRAHFVRTATRHPANLLAASPLAPGKHHIAVQLAGGTSSCYMRATVRKLSGPPARHKYSALVGDRLMVGLQTLTLPV